MQRPADTPHPLSLPVPGIWPWEKQRLLFRADISMSGWGLRQVLFSSCFSPRCTRNMVWFWSCHFALKCVSSSRKRGSCSFPFIICYPAWFLAGSLMIYRDSYGNGNLWWYQKLIVGVRDPGPSLECFGKVFDMTMLAKPLWYVRVSLTLRPFENYL